MKKKDYFTMYDYYEDDDTTSILDSQQMAAEKEAEKAAETDVKKKRGRKPKASENAEDKEATRKARKKKAGHELTSVLTTVSALLAGLTNKPEVELTPDESNALSDAATEVASYYTIPDLGATGAWINLGITLSVIIYPRAMLFRKPKKSAKNEQPKPEAEVNNASSL